ncbi:ATP-binding protein [Streptomyces sp. NPDC045431]|uniref:ATP-binding protein n=1 Tax=Streptomyces sp. NPDC045431 TaxID=3155613 RepID=UPI00340A6B57
MNPMNRGPAEYGPDKDDNGTGGDGSHRAHSASRDDAAPRERGGERGAERGLPAGPARTAQIVAGDLLLTVNPIDGSEIEPCPPGRQPAPPGRRTAEERVERARAAGPPVPPGPAARHLTLLERQGERERLVRLLARGRSVRLTGPHGSGRTALLDAVAADCADLAPDGVVRLSGHRRTATELLHELFATVYRAPGQRPDRAGLPAAVREIGAVVVVDDLEFGGTALDELLDAAPECAFLLATTPDVAAPSPDSHLEEVFLGGLGRGSVLELLERGVDRALTDEEANWAADLWFESEGLPLRFVQAGALLRQRDELSAGAGTGAGSADADEDGDPELADDASGDADVFTGARALPLPTLAEGAAPAALLASRLSESARETLRFAVALGGEVPHQAHLPALVGDTHADAALAELLGCGLLTPVGSRHRLASGVLAQLTRSGYDKGAVARAHTAAQHYAWWAAHPSVTSERACAEADAVLAAMAALVPGGEAGHASAAVLLARSAAPAFAAGLHWAAWERALRTGQEAARISGEVAEEAYFHHELGVLALCSGNLDRARAELEASIGMRGALADKRGTVAGRRALALVADRERGALSAGRTAAGEVARREEPETPSGGVPTPAGGLGALPYLPGLSRETPSGALRKDAPGTPGTAPGAASARPGQAALGAGPLGAGPRPSAPGSSPSGPSGPGTSGPGSAGPGFPRPGASRPGLSGLGSSARRALLAGARRNVVAASAGALLAAVLGTVVTLGATSGGEEDEGGSGRVTSDQTATVDDGNGGGSDTEEPGQDSTRDPAGGSTGGSGGTGGPGGSGGPGASARPGESGSAGSPTAPGGGTPSATTGSTSTSGTSPTSGGSSSTSTGGSSSPSSTGGGSSSPATTGGSSGDPSPSTSGGSTTSPAPTTSGGSTTGDAGSSTSGSTTGDPTTGGTADGGADSGGTDTTSGGAGGGTTGGGTDTTGGTTTDGGAPSSS